jgi:peptidyl-prolyl cis-trans isomerase SurA
MQLINLEVKSKIIIREEKIREFYDEHKDQFSSQEKVHLAGIFLGQKDPSNQRETRSLHEKAQTIFNRLKTGEDFGELAKEMSQGPGAKEGGDLGFFKTTELDPRLQEAIKELPEDSISEPIITPSGIQIIKLLERQKGRTKPLEEVKNAIYEILYQEEVNKRYSSWIKKLREKAYTKIIF